MAEAVLPTTVPDLDLMPATKTSPASRPAAPGPAEEFPLREAIERSAAQLRRRGEIADGRALTTTSS